MIEDIRLGLPLARSVHEDALVLAVVFVEIIFKISNCYI
jgi:hypothetical protein